MISVRRATERHLERRRKQEIWHTFFPGDGASPFAKGFGHLEALDEDLLPPGGGAARHPHRDSEIITYVREGALSHEDSMGLSGVIHAGEFQRMTAGHGLRHSETNASRTDWAHVFQMCFHPAEADLEPSHAQSRFSAAERRGVLRVIASPDGRRGSLRIHQDAIVYSAILDRGQHLVHELANGRSAWLHVVLGQVMLGDEVLGTGDGAGLVTERAVSFTAQEEAEVLLLDLGEPKVKSSHEGGVT